MKQKRNTQASQTTKDIFVTVFFRRETLWLQNEWWRQNKSWLYLMYICLSISNIECCVKIKIWLASVFYMLCTLKEDSTLDSLWKNPLNKCCKILYAFNFKVAMSASRKDLDSGLISWVLPALIMNVLLSLLEKHERRRANLKHILYNDLKNDKLQNGSKPIQPNDLWQMQLSIIYNNKWGVSSIFQAFTLWINFYGNPKMHLIR